MVLCMLYILGTLYATKVGIEEHRGLEADLEAVSYFKALGERIPSPRGWIDL